MKKKPLKHISQVESSAVKMSVVEVLNVYVSTFFGQQSFCLLQTVQLFSQKNFLFFEKINLIKI